MAGDSGPSINVKLDPAVFAALDQVGSATKAQRAVVRDLEREVRAMAKTGQDVSKDLAGRLQKARDDLERLEGLKVKINANGAGGNAGVGREPAGSFFNQRGGELGREFKHGRRLGRELGEIGRSVSEFGKDPAGGAAEALSGLGHLAGRSSALGIGLIGLALAVRELDAGLKGNEKHFETRKELRADTKESQQELGERASEDFNQKILKRFKDAEVKKLGWLDRAAQQYSKQDGVVGLFVRGGADFLGLSTRDEDVEAKAKDDIKRGLEVARHHAEQAYKAAGMGDIGRAEKEINAANVAVKNQFNLQETFGSAIELYLRQENVRRFRAEYTQFQQRRGNLRTGD